MTIRLLESLVNAANGGVIDKKRSPARIAIERVGRSARFNGNSRLALYDKDGKLIIRIDGPLKELRRARKNILRFGLCNRCHEGLAVNCQCEGIFQNPRLALLGAMTPIAGLAVVGFMKHGQGWLDERMAEIRAGVVPEASQNT